MWYTSQAKERGHMNFTDLQLKNELIKAINEIGYKNPSPIQEEAIPILLEGHDLIGQSQTGSGKTAAFGLPILNKIQANVRRTPQALILCPTRELCIQVTDELRKFSKYLQSIRIVSVYGGQEISRQIKEIKGGADIVVATPGRLLDHMRRSTLRFHDNKVVIIDEADEMLNMGFIEEVTQILNQLPEAQQKLLFSATMPQEIKQLADQFLTQAKHIQIKNKTLTVTSISQSAYQVLPTQKTQLLIQLLELNQFDSCIIFCNTKKEVDNLSSTLNKQGYFAMALHGDIKQEARSAIMQRFKRKELDILIATDVAARGIDVNDLDAVINYDIPQELEYYVHRIGRTGRAGKKGIAITLYTPRQKGLLNHIEKMTRQPIERIGNPNQQDLQKLTINTVLREIETASFTHAKQVDLILDTLYKQGYTDQSILRGLLSKLIAASTLAPIEEVKTSEKKQAMASLMINLGSKHEVQAAMLVSSICQASNLTGKQIGRIKISDRSSIVEVPQASVSQLLKKLPKTKIKGKFPFVSLVDKKAK